MFKPKEMGQVQCLLISNHPWPFSQGGKILSHERTQGYKKGNGQPLRVFRSSPFEKGSSIASTNKLGEFGFWNLDSSQVFNFICSYFGFLYLLLVLNCFLIKCIIEPFHFINLINFIFEFNILMFNSLFCSLFFQFDVLPMIYEQSSRLRKGNPKASHPSTKMNPYMNVHF